MSVYKFKFESIQELLAAAAQPHVNEQNATHNHYSSLGDDPNYVCAKRKIRNQNDVTAALQAPTFNAGVQMIEDLAREILAPTPVSRRRKAVRSDAGDELDMQRVYQGELHSAWSAVRREQSVGPSRVLIVVAATASSGVTSHELAFRGAAALALACKLKDAGYTVSIVAGREVRVEDSSSSRYSAEVTILAPDHELDVHKLASLIASGLLVRGVLLDHTIRCNTDRVGSGLGRPMPLQDDTVDTSGYDYVAKIEAGSVSDAYSANVWLAKHIEALRPTV